MILFTVALLVATGLNLLFMSRVSKENYVDALKSELFAQANSLKSQMTRITDLGISVKDIEGFDVVCLDLVKKNKSLLDAMVIDEEGTILYHSNPMFHGKKIKPAKTISLVRQKQPTLLNFTEKDSDFYRAVVPFQETNRSFRYGVVATCSAEMIDAKVMNLISECNAFFLLTFGLAALLLLFSLTHLLTRPLDIILRTIKTVSDTKTLQQHINMNTDDEIGHIAAAFNKMTEDLHHSTTSIEYLNEEIKIRKQAENQAQSARRDAEMANKMKNIFLANMSHEIRTPMNALMGFAEILNEEHLTPEQKNYVRIILDNAHALLSLLNDILDFSKIEAGRLVLEKINCCPSQILENIAASMSPLAAHKGLELKLIQSPNVPDTIYTDPSRLHQCLANLVGNAIKYTHRGHVYIRVLVGESENQQKIYFIIEDTGVGIPKDKIGQIFDAYAQMSNGSAGQDCVTDLGLSITKQLVDLMGGQIFVVSEQGKGTVFTITLPLEKPVKASAPQPATTSA